MIHMSITLWFAQLQASGVRWLGALFALVPGMVLTVPMLMSGERSTDIGRGIALAAGPIGAALGWCFAPATARAGLRPGMVVAARFAALAVVIGAFLVGAWATTTATSADANHAFTDSAFLGLVGLIVLGLPMWGLTFLIALVWVGALRLATRSRDHGAGDIPSQ